MSADSGAARGTHFFELLEGWDVSRIPEAMRRVLASEWQRAALMEHASIGSFARFSLQLLAVGAPPELVERAHLAALDEVRHARICFALAGKLRGEALGPGPMSLPPNLLDAMDLPAVVESTVVEGCVGETIAALEAERALELCEDPVVSAALEIIALEESDHADLAWTFTSWAFRVGGQLVGARIAEATTRALREAREVPTLQSTLDSELAAFGRLGREERVQVRQVAVDEVLRSCFDELLAHREQPPPPAERARLR